MPQVLPPDSPLRVFIAHGIYPHVNGTGQGVATCPVCGKDKLHINISSGLWDCKTCIKEGNPLSFLRMYHDECLKFTTEQQYTDLAQERGYLSIESLLRWGVAWSDLRQEWIIPGYFRDTDELKNLYRWTDYGSKDGKRHLQSTPTFNQCLYNIRNFDPNKSDVWITEGPWDGIISEEAFRCIKSNPEGFEYTGNEDSSIYANVNVVSLPSANVLNELWAMMWRGKRIFICLDNDKAGEEGCKRIVARLIEWDIQPKEIHYVKWGSDLPSGYDVRDLLSRGYTGIPSTPTERITAYETRCNNVASLFELIKPIPIEWIDPQAKSGDKVTGKKKIVGLRISACESWDTLVEHWKKALVWHDGLDKTLSVMLACTMSTSFPGTQLWLRVISPPSTGKSVLCDALCVNRDYVTMQSNIRGFFSGMRPTKKDAREGKTDLGLITEIMGKTFVTKDADPILQAPERPRIMAEARDLYDGGTKTHFRTGTGQEYPTIRTTWILCGTDRVRDADENDLGGRFLDCIILKDASKNLKRSIALMAIANMRNLMKHKVTEDIESMDESKRLIAKKLTGGYIDHLCRNGQKLVDQVTSHEDIEVDDRIATLAEFVSIMRARPSKQDENPTVELYTRLSEQLFRLAACLTVVLNKTRIDSDVINRVTDIAFDTSEGTTLRMTRYLHKDGNGGKTYTDLQSELLRKEGHLSELLRFLVRVGAYEQYEQTFYNRNVTGDVKYRLSKELRQLCDKVFAYQHE